MKRFEVKKIQKSNNLKDNRVELSTHVAVGGGAV